jgi:hypothetical protein
MALFSSFNFISYFRLVIQNYVLYTFFMTLWKTIPHADLTPPQEQTGKGPHLRGARASNGRPAKARAVGRMQTGEVEAKVHRGVGLKDSLRRACCVARTPKGPLDDVYGAFLLRRWCCGRHPNQDRHGRACPGHPFSRGGAELRWPLENGWPPRGRP